MKHWRLLACLLLLLLIPPARAAIIEAMLSLEYVITESNYILYGKLEKVDKDNLTAVVAVERAVKGEKTFNKVNINLGMGPAHQAKYMVQRLKVGEPALVFYKLEQGRIAAEVHSGDVFFQLYANDEPAKRDQVWWRLVHVEVRLNRTYNGTTSNFVQLLDDIMAKKAVPPKPNPDVPMIEVASQHLLGVQLTKVAGKANGFVQQLQMHYEPGGEVRGVCFTDVRGKGLPDVYVQRKPLNILLLNKGSRSEFEECGQAEGSVAASWADYQGEGRPSVLMTGNHMLYTNVDGHLLRDDTALIPGGPRGMVTSCGWIDYNGDGRPDILMSTADGAVYLFENTGQGPVWFVDVSQKVGLGPRSAGRAAGGYINFWDYDGDGFADLFFSTGVGPFLHNLRGKGFTPDGAAGLVLPSGPGFQRGLAVGDYDNDGVMDVFVPSVVKSHLYHNNNDGTFTDVIEQSGDLAKVTGVFSAVWADVNGDGNQDVFLCCPRGQSHLLLGDGQGRFTDVTKEVGLDGVAQVYAAGFADLDGDGRVDLVLHAQDQVVIAYNDLPTSQDRRLLTVSVKPKWGAIGAVVRVLDEKGRFVAMRELAGARDCGGSTGPFAYFGLPKQSCKVYVALSDGRLACKALPVTADDSKCRLDFQEADFQ